MKRLTPAETRRIKPGNAANRAALCGKWLEEMDAKNKFDPRNVRRTGEKKFRLGEVKGGNQNFRIWVDEHT